MKYGRNITAVSGKKTIPVLLVFILVFAGACEGSMSERMIRLEGEWQFRTDSQDQGVTKQWYLEELGDNIILPGSMKENGKGMDPSLQTNWTGSIYDSSWYFNPHLEPYRTGDTLRFPFWLTPVKHYVGPAWYRKKVTIPENWKGNRILLHLERPHWETTVWIDSTLVSNQHALSVPHETDLTDYLDPGVHHITIRVDNRLDDINVGPDSHSVTDHTQGNWNGIIGDMYLSNGPLVHIESMQLHPDIGKQEVKAVIRIASPGQVKSSVEMDVFARSVKPAPRHATGRVHGKFTLMGGTDTLEMILPMGPELNTWDEFDPHLYNFTAELSHNGEKSRKTVRFGMREISTRGKQILVNGNPVFMRGNVDCAVFPLTGYPAMDVESWLKIFGQLKAFGLNHVRFHSWCPPRAAFDAADQLGFYLQPEGPTWPNHGTSLGNGRSIDQYIYEETSRILEQYGNHPSFCMYASGNEPRGNYVAFLEDFLRYWKNEDPRRIYTGASIGGSWKECQENEFHVKGGARGLPWSRQRPGSTFGYERNIARFDVPFITHELGQYCVYPDFKEIDNYTGSYRAYNFELFRDLAGKNHVDHLSEQFLAASGELQKRCYKYEMEATLRTEGMAGYQLLGLNDFPGQGTALVGVLNAFYEPKGYAGAEYFRQFCGPVTLLATLPKFVWEADETFSANVLLSNYGSVPVSNERIHWKITGAQGEITVEGQITAEHKVLPSGEQTAGAQGEVLAEGHFSSGDFPVGKVAETGTIQFDLSGITRARKLTLHASMQGTYNHWDFWVYPEKLPGKGSGIHITDTLDPVADSMLREGGKVLLLASGKVENGREVVQYFTPVFWNTSWFKMRPPHTTGVLIRNDHPVFDNFPTSFHSDMQWWEILNRQQVMHLENFPPDFRPLVQPIDTWFISRRLGLLWEAASGEGKLMVCSADLLSDPEQRPAARQLLFSILDYMEKETFQPEQEVPLEVVKELFEKKERRVIHLYTRNSPDELKPISTTHR